MVCKPVRIAADAVAPECPNRKAQSTLSTCKRAQTSAGRTDFERRDLKGGAKLDSTADRTSIVHCDLSGKHGSFTAGHGERCHDTMPQGALQENHRLARRKPQWAKADSEYRLLCQHHHQSRAHN